MHAINGDFTAGAHDTADNIFMGSARSNTELHFGLVENPIRGSMQRITAGTALRYQKVMTSHPPQRLTGYAKTLGWSSPGLVIPGLTELDASLSARLYPDTRPFLG